jgi:hypothetical protein
MRVLAVLFVLALALPAAAQQITDDQVKQQIIAASIASYPGNCPCPYNRAANGSKCGKRSAWSRAGGYSPICYSEEVTEDMVAAWRTKHGG